MKTLFLLLILLFSTSVFAQLGTWKTLTAGSTYDVLSQGQWLIVEVYDASNADTVTASYPMKPASTTYYAVIGSIKELATDDMVLGLYGDADAKVYMIWFPYPTSMRFTLSTYASGDVIIRAYNKP